MKKQKTQKSIMFVGLMGSGKTSIGKRVAKKLGLHFFDCDLEVEKAAGCTVAEFFEFFGEKKYRETEKLVAKKLLDMPPCIIATGGGTFIIDEIREYAKDKAITIWLKADLETLVFRTQGRTHRPLLNNVDIKQKLSELIQNRYPIYSSADIVIDSINESVEKTLTRVIDKIKEIETAKEE